MEKFYRKSFCTLFSKAAKNKYIYFTEITRVVFMLMAKASQHYTQKDIGCDKQFWYAIDIIVLQMKSVSQFHRVQHC